MLVALFDHLPLPAPLTQVHPALLIPPYRLPQAANRTLPYFDRHPLQPVHVDHSRERGCRRPLPLHRLLIALPAEEKGRLGGWQLLPPLGELLDIGEILLHSAGIAPPLPDDIQLLEVGGPGPYERTGRR